MKNRYNIMHKDRKMAAVDVSGHCKIYDEAFMPYNLYLEKADDVDTLVNNVTNFYYWCSTRLLTLDRAYAKEILNSAGVRQAVTDKDRAKIALICRCASITDVFWVKKEEETVAFSDINLYENHLDRTFIDISLRGKQYTVENRYLARDMSTNGCFPKAWKRVGKGFVLLKDGQADVVERELLASRICRCFDASQVLYEEGCFDGEKVTVSENMTSGAYSIASMEAFEVYAQNHDIDIKEYILKLDRYNYYMMNILDYLTGNTDRHWGNWGVFVDTSNNKPVSLHKLMDFNRAFHVYDDLDGANCQTAFGARLTQKEAAVQAVKEIGLNQIQEVKKEFFTELPQYYSMFNRRLTLLRHV